MSLASAMGHAHATLLTSLNGMSEILGDSGHPTLGDFFSSHTKFVYLDRFFHLLSFLRRTKYEPRARLEFPPLPFPHFVLYTVQASLTSLLKLWASCTLRYSSAKERCKSTWARTPPSASWRFDSGRDRPPPYRRERSPRRRSLTPPRRSRGDYSPRKDDRERRDRDYDRRDRDRSRSPDDRDREMKDVRDRRDDEDDRENGTNGDDRKVPIDSPMGQHDDLDTAE
ncbi:MAG: hypothetical protein Q9214_000958 [Letrouitia sp. 1 TL-2023]